MRSVITKKRHKDEINAQLINILDRDYDMLKSYPQTDHETRLEFWSNRDPTLKPDFEVLLHIYRKKCKVTLHGSHDYFIEVDDDR